MDNTMKAMTSGTVLAIRVREGDEVDVEQIVAVLESMKMELEVRSSIAGRVKRVAVKEGDGVEQGQVLLEFG